MPAITNTSTYSRMDGSMPLLTMWGTACATSASVPNGASTVDDAVNLGWTFTVTSVVTASVPSEPIRSWVRSYPLEHLTNLPPVRSTPAVGQHHLQPEHVVAGHAVAHGAHATRIGGDVPAEGAALLAGGDRVDEPERGQLGVELLERHAGLHHCDLVLGVDLSDPLHAVEGEEKPVGHRDGGARESGAAATGDDRHAVLVCDLQDLGDLARGAGQDEGQRDHGHELQGLVVGVVAVHRRAGHDVALTHGLAQLF